MSVEKAEEALVSKIQEKEHIAISIDETLRRTGCGKFHYLAQALITFLVFAFGYHCILSYFIASDPSWKCVTNHSSEFCAENYGKIFPTYNQNFSRRCMLARSEWTYVTDRTYSIVTEFDLVCDRTAVAAFASSVFHIGGSIGIFIFGVLGDYLGRKKTLLVALSFLSVASLSCGFVCNETQLIVLRLIVGATTIPCYAFSCMFMSEFVAPRYRTMVVIVFSMGYVSSEFAINALAYFVRNWRNVQIYATLPCFFGVIALLFLPQSPRWLLAHDRKSEAESTLRKIGRCNGKPVDSITLQSQIVQEDRKYTYWDLIRSKKVSLLTMPQLFVWFTGSMAFYTISFQSSNLGGDMYQAFALSVTAEVPSKFMGYHVCQYFGRKKSTLISLILTSVFAASTTLIPQSFAYIYESNLSLMMIAKFFADIAVQGMYIWTFELFPTVIRGQGTALCIAFERMGSFTAPFLTSVLYQLNPKFPMIILIVFAFSAAGIGFLLPETNKRPTRERYEDIFQTSQDSLIKDETQI